MFRSFLILSLICFAVGCGGVPEGASEEAAPAVSASAGASYVGWLADEKCANEGKAATDDHTGCAQGCIKGGEAIVLVSEEGGKIYKLDDQNSASPHAGHKVTVTGTLSGDTITVSSVSM